MKKIDVEITGETPLLMHSAQAMVQQTAKSNPAKKYDIKKDAEAVAYRNEKKNLYVPSTCLKACFVNAATWYKIGQKGAKSIVAGCTRIEGKKIPSELEITDKKGKVLKKYEIDLRTVVIQRNRIVRARPRLDEWRLNFYIVYNDELVDTSLLEKVMKESGERIGLLDFRPNKGGEFGSFKITKWKVI